MQVHPLCFLDIEALILFGTLEKIANQLFLVIFCFFLDLQAQGQKDIVNNR